MYYQLNRQNQFQALLRKLAENYQIAKRSTLKKNITYFDTFDWRLYQNDLILYQQDNVFYLSSLKNQKEIGSWTVPGGKSYRFWWDFPGGELQKRLTTLLDIRALLPLLSCRVQITPHDILNEDQKVITRIFLQHYSLNSGGRPKPRLEVEPIRGYSTDYQRINRLIKEAGIAAETQPYPLHLYQKAHLIPGGYSSKINIQLQPAMPAREALRRMLLQFLSIIKLNLTGILEDWDSEFLHDFRVAMRRSRSIMGQAKHVFPNSRISQFRRRLGTLQKSTNHLRDLDVYLLRKEQYRSILPEKFRPGIDFLFQKIQQERSQEHQKIKAALSSPSCLKVITEWENYLQNRNIPNSRNSDLKIFPFSRRIISLRLQKVLQKGNQLLGKKPAQNKLHELRIECKKLRYLLEFFSSLYPEKKISLLVDHLKILQDLLGDINDLSIQIRDLDWRFELSRQSQQPESLLLAAMAGLLTYFYQKQSELKKQFQETFRKFSNPELLATAQHLFG
jgi:CHAD domain-containing protein